jgi:purine nucleosidase
MTQSLNRLVLLDCDPGIDDALAILLALASPEIDLAGVTTVAGNSIVENETRNALAVLELGGASLVPVAQGCARPLIKDLTTAADTHGESGLGYATLPQPKTWAIQQHAIDFLIDTILSRPNEITLVATGPLTNIALALRKAPRIVNAVRDVIIMGGALKHVGNMPMKAEFNVWCDPHAAHIVFHSGLPITLAPLDVTYECILTHEHVQRISRESRVGSRNSAIANRQSPIANFIDDATRFYIEYHDSAQNIEGCAINDALALALVFAPDLVRTQDLYVTVDLSDGPAHAGTFADFWKLTGKAPNMKAALEVDAERFLELFVERVGRLASMRS